MSTFQLVSKAKQFLKKNASKHWEQSYRIKDEDKYLYPLNGLAILIRVEYHSIRAFYWFYDMADSNKFITYVHEELHSEAHEIIINTNRIKLFFDIDLVLTESELEGLIEFYEELSGEDDLDIDDVARHLSHLYFSATLASLEEHGNDLNKLEQECDMMFSTRNRELPDGSFKISIHVITNIVCSINQCKAVVNDIKTNILVDPEEYSLSVCEDYITMIIDAIDTMPYHQHGSLSIVGGRKIVDGVEYVNDIRQCFQWKSDENFITRIDSILDCIEFKEYSIIGPISSDSSGDVSEEFKEIVLSHLHRIPYYDHSNWDISLSSLKGCTMILRRTSPSECSNCDRVHDLDNTLLIAFNEEKGLGLWKCLHAPTIKAKVFYKEERVDEDLESFANAHSCKIMSKFNSTDSSHIESTNESYEEQLETEDKNNSPKSKPDLNDSNDIPAEESYAEPSAEIQILNESKSDLNDSEEIPEEETYVDHDIESMLNTDTDQASNIESESEEESDIASDHEYNSELSSSESSDDSEEESSDSDEESDISLSIEAYDSDPEAQLKKKSNSGSVGAELDSVGGFLKMHGRQRCIL